MNKRQSYRPILRFRKWSRKAYAAFASLGQCVTIGCLPKNVADCSLSKLKTGTTAGCKSGGRSLEETNDEKGRETDIGVPLGCEINLRIVSEIFGFKVLQPILCPVNIGQLGEEHTDIIINQNETQMTRTIQRPFC